MNDELLSIRVTDRSARDGGWQAMPPALTPRRLTMPSRNDVLRSCSQLTAEDQAWLAAMSDVRWAKRAGKIANAVIAGGLIAFLIWFTVSGGPNLILGK